MKWGIVILCFLILLSFFVCLFGDSSLMYGNERLQSDELNYYTHNIFKTCFATSYTWTADKEYAVLTIPDQYNGYRVVSLGGFIGSGFPCSFCVIFPEATAVRYEDTLPEGAQIERYHLVINIGKHIREDKLISMDCYHCIGDNQFIQVLVTVNCPEENTAFYSKNGKLYRKIDDSLVEGFFYFSDFF